MREIRNLIIWLGIKYIILYAIAKSMEKSLIEARTAPTK